MPRRTTSTTKTASTVTPELTQNQFDDEMLITAEQFVSEFNLLPDLADDANWIAQFGGYPFYVRSTDMPTDEFIANWAVMFIESESSESEDDLKESVIQINDPITYITYNGNNYLLNGNTRWLMVNMLMAPSKSQKSLVKRYGKVSFNPIKVRKYDGAITPESLIDFQTVSNDSTNEHSFMSIINASMDYADMVEDVIKSNNDPALCKDGEVTPSGLNFINKKVLEAFSRHFSADSDSTKTVKIYRMNQLRKAPGWLRDRVDAANTAEARKANGMSFTGDTDDELHGITMTTAVKFCEVHRKLDKLYKKLKLTGPGYLGLNVFYNVLTNFAETDSRRKRLPHYIDFTQRDIELFFNEEETKLKIDAGVEKGIPKKDAIVEETNVDIPESNPNDSESPELETTSKSIKLDTDQIMIQLDSYVHLTDNPANTAKSLGPVTKWQLLNQSIPVIQKIVQTKKVQLNDTEFDQRATTVVQSILELLDFVYPHNHIKPDEVQNWSKYGLDSLLQTMNAVAYEPKVDSGVETETESEAIAEPEPEQDEDEADDDAVVTVISGVSALDDLEDSLGDDDEGDEDEDEDEDEDDNDAVTVLNTISSNDSKLNLKEIANS